MQQVVLVVLDKQVLQAELVVLAELEQLVELAVLDRQVVLAEQVKLAELVELVLVVLVA